MDNTSINIQQLKEMHSKLQNLNTNVTNAIGKSREFHTKLEGKLQESLSKLQENLDQSVNTDRVQQNEKLLLDIHSHFEMKCSQIEEQNLNLVNRLRLMEKQEEDYKNQIDNLNTQLQEKGLKGHFGSQCSNQQHTFSFKPNSSQAQQDTRDMSGEYSAQQLEESFYLKSEIEKLNKEIEILMEEKKKIVAQQEQNQQYLQEHQISYFDQLNQSELSTGSKKSCKVNEITVASFQHNDLQNVSKQNSPQRNERFEDHLDSNEEHITRGGRFSPTNKPHANANLKNVGSQIRLISPSNQQLKNSIHQLSPSKVGFGKSQSAHSSQKKLIDNKTDNKEQDIRFIKSEIEQRLIMEYEAKLQQANRELLFSKELQQKQTEELMKERDIRIQMQLKLEGIEAERRYQNITNNESYSKTGKGITTADSFSSPNPNQATLCHTPSRNQADTSQGKQYNNQNSLGYSSVSEYASPHKSTNNKPLTTTNSYSIDTQSNQKFQPIHTTLKLNKLNNPNNGSAISNNESNYTYQISVSPNNRNNQNKTSSSNRSSQDSSQVQQQLIDIISKLQNSMSNKKRALTPLKDSQKQIETAKKFENAIEGTLSQLKQILTTQDNNNNQQNQHLQNQLSGSSSKQDPSFQSGVFMQSNPQQQYLYNNSMVYTTEFNSNQ